MDEAGQQGAGVQNHQPRPGTSGFDLAALIERIVSQPTWSEADACLREHERKLDFPDLIALVDACRERYPSIPGPAFRLAILWAQKGDAERARAAHDEACEHGLPDDKSDHFFQTLYWSTRDWESLATLTPPLLAHSGQVETSPWLRVAIARLMCFDVNGGVKAARLHEQLCPGPAEHVLVITRMLIEGRAAKTARRFLDALAETRPGLPELIVAGHALDVCAPHTRKPDAVVLPQTHADKTDPDMDATQDWVLKHLRSERHAPKLAPPGAEDMDLLKTALHAALQDDFSTALDGLERFLASPRPDTIAGRVGETRDLIRGLARLPAPQRELLSDRKGDCLVSEPDPSGRVALVFSSLADRAAGMPVRFLDGILARQGFQMIFLRDYSRCAFTCGIRSLGTTAEATLASLRDLLEREQARSLITIGMSGGGYASLRYGIALGADALFAFSGGTVAKPADMEALGDRRVPVVARLTERRATQADFTRPVRDVLAELETAPSIHLFFGDESNEDRAHAEDLSGFAGVTLHPVHEHGRHDVFTTLLSQGFSFDLQPEPETAS